MIRVVSNTYEIVFINNTHITYGESSEFNESILSISDIKSIVNRHSLGKLLLTPEDIAKVQALVPPEGVTGSSLEEVEVEGVPTINSVPLYRLNNSGSYVLTTPDIWFKSNGYYIPAYIADTLGVIV